MIEGSELVDCVEIPEPQKVFNEVLLNLRKAYLEAWVIHADLSEFNVVIQPDWHVLIIDWPQYVRKDHPNAEQLLRRDVRNMVRFFQRKFKTKTRLKEALAYVKGAA